MAAPQKPETRRLYARDWAAFEAWCATWGQTPLPASPATAAAYLALLTRRLASGALARHAAALNDRHRRAGHPAPGDDPTVQAVLQAARAVHRATQETAPAAQTSSRRATPPGPAQLVRIAMPCGTDQFMPGSSGQIGHGTRRHAIRASTGVTRPGPSTSKIAPPSDPAPEMDDVSSAATVSSSRCATLRGSPLQGMSLASAAEQGNQRVGDGPPSRLAGL